MTTNYDNRLVDVELLQSIVVPGAIQRVHVTSVGQDPKIVAGIEKAVQRYAVLLLTSLGNVKFAETMGGELVLRLMQGNVQNLGYLRHVFSMANSNALRVLAKDDADPVFGAIPDDERITRAVLVDASVDYSTGTVMLEVKLTTAAGTAYDFTVPINTMR